MVLDIYWEIAYKIIEKRWGMKETTGKREKKELTTFMYTLSIRKNNYKEFIFLILDKCF